jgi:hypothetical protein
MNDDHKRVEHRLAKIASRHIAPEHVDRALTHYADSVGKAMRKKKLTPEQFDAFDDEHHNAAFAQIAKDNPAIARAPTLPPKTLQTFTLQPKKTK